MEQILRLFSIRIRECFLQANIFEMFAGELEEIRVRVNQPIELVTARGEYFLKNDTLVSFPAVPIGNCRRSAADEYADVTVFALCLRGGSSAGIFDSGRGTSNRCVRSGDAESRDNR